MENREVKSLVKKLCKVMRKTDVANYCGVKYLAVNNWSKGHNTPTPASMLKLHELKLKKGV